MENNINTLNSLLAQSSTSLTLGEGLTILTLALIAGIYLRGIYGKLALTLSSKVSFGNTLLLVTVSVASLVAVVKASLALSLGLVGALSVIRFRTAVKEPYNLSFLLFSICLGISLGASQYMFSVLIGIFGTLAIGFSYKSSKQTKNSNWALNVDEIDTVSITIPPQYDLNKLFDILTIYTSYYSILSLDQLDNEPQNIVLSVSLNKSSSITKLKKDIFFNFPGSSFSFYNSPQI